MKNITTTVYEFSELGDAARVAALDEYRYINVDDHDWSTSSLDYHKKHLQGLGFEAARIWFSGFGSQGDGACFDAAVDVRKLFLTFVADREIRRQGRAVENPNKLVRIVRIIQNHRDKLADLISSVVELQICGTYHASRYSHENCRDIEGLVRLTKDYRLLDQILTEFFAWATECMRHQSREIYRALEQEYYWLMEDEQVRAAIEAHGYLFCEDGTLAKFL
jgi:hypothetical protein